MNKQTIIEKVFLIFILYFNFSLLYFSKYIVFDINPFFGKTFLVLSFLVPCFLFFVDKWIVWLLSFVLWGFLYLINPYVINVSYPIVTLLYLFILVKKNSKISQSNKDFISALLMCYFAIHYFSIGVQKLFNPLWINGDVLLSYAKTEMPNSLIANLFLAHPLLTVGISYSVIFVELQSILLIFRKTRNFSIVLLFIFHIMTNVVFEIYVMPLFIFLYLLGYILMIKLIQSC
jgi:hypothetical protein